jgi:hypothetical protein
VRVESVVHGDCVAAGVAVAALGIADEKIWVTPKATQLDGAL